MAGVLQDLVAGAALLGRGLALVVRRPRMFRLGALPPLLTSVLLTGLLVLLGTELDAVLAWLTPFADGWSPAACRALRAGVGLALVAGALLLMVITFSALTLALGGPLYDRISESVDAELGAAPSVVEERWTTGLARGLRQSLVLVAVSVLVGLGLFLAGLVPVVGQTVVPVVSAVFGGWMLGIELVGSAFERRGRLTLAERRGAMRRRRALVLGFTVPTFLLLAIPFVSVVVFPVATAGGTLLARRLLDAEPG